MCGGPVMLLLRLRPALKSSLGVPLHFLLSHLPMRFCSLSYTPGKSVLTGHFPPCFSASSLCSAWFSFACVTPSPWPWWVSCLCCPVVHDSWAGVGVCPGGFRIPLLCRGLLSALLRLLRIQAGRILRHARVRTKHAACYSVPWRECGLP